MKFIKFFLFIVIICLSFCAGMKYQANYVDKGIKFSFSNKKSKDSIDTTTVKSNDDLVKENEVETITTDENVNFDLLNEENVNLENMPNDAVNTNSNESVVNSVENSNNNNSSPVAVENKNNEIQEQQANNNVVDNNNQPVVNTNANNQIENNISTEIKQELPSSNIDAVKQQLEQKPVVDNTPTVQNQ